MSLWADAAKVATGLNVVLLAVLLAVWVRNYLQFRSKHTLGLALFCVFLLAHNAVYFYIYLVDPMLSGWFSTAVPVLVWRFLMALAVFETLGLAVLAWTTLD
ncbi:hypothetical protein GCM10009037_09000 [Halarchaeum grantii]|uniref:Uncharacterized protein n=1 Tax=Halarchaeum grantii TaxID=1193105 RepID=A0A830F0A2_9EURY|nr:hypothetical protein [Halarchaeum grantii]GGL27614.1 hypothetical protein GCM10009037_09000 [Halarchaeum grantii]